MDVTRSGFLKGMAASACLAGAGCRMAGGAPVPGAHDPNLVVVISDVHTGLPWSKQQYRTGREYPWMPEAAKRLVRAILAMDPRPSLVLDLGDLSLAFGEEGDYEVGAEVLRPLTDAGIQVVHTMGNHDIRANFLKSFPGADAGTKVPGRFTHVVSTPHADFIVLDSLQEPVRRGSYDACTVKGLGKEQTDWLKATLLEARRPTFVCAHHAIPELGVARHVARCPYVVGSLHGHNHHWATDYFADGYGENAHTIRSVGMPSFGLDRDIGFGVLRLGAKSAKLTCRIFDYYFPTPRTPRPASWDAFVRDNDGHTVEFVFDSLADARSVEDRS